MELEKVQKLFIRDGWWWIVCPYCSGEVEVSDSEDNPPDPRNHVSCYHCCNDSTLQPLDSYGAEVANMVEKAFGAEDA